MIDRRRWILNAAGLVALPLHAPAQQQGTPRIGVLSFGAAPGSPNADPSAGLREGLQALGYVEGRNLTIEWRYADGRLERLAAAAAELVQMNVAVILAGGPASIHSARAATSTIPILAIGGVDPVAEGWAQSLARPAGNTTGFTVSFAELGPKRLEILKQARPGLGRVAVMFEAAQVKSGTSDLLMAGARRLGLDLQMLEVREPAEFEPALDRARRSGAEALYVIATNLVVTYRRRLGELAQRERLPSISEFPLMAEAGFLLSYGADLEALGRRAATYIDKILKGVRPGELPIQRPTEFQLVVNLQTARAIGITLPAATLERADRVIP